MSSRIFRLGEGKHNRHVFRFQETMSDQEIVDQLNSLDERNMKLQSKVDKITTILNLLGELND